MRFSKSFCQFLITVFLFFLQGIQSFKANQTCAFRFVKLNNNTKFLEPFNGDPFPNNPTISNFCPNFSNETEKVCCNTTQIEDLNQRFNRITPQIFSKCPTCLENIKKFWCEFVCSPFQNIFIQDEEIEKKDNYTIITNLTLKINENFADNLYQSCKSVEVNGEYLIEDEYATSRDFFHYILYLSSPLTNITFKFINSNESNFEAIENNLKANNLKESNFEAIENNLKEIVFLNQSNGLNTMIYPCETNCSCQNCYSSCKNVDLPNFDFYEKDKEIKILNHNVNILGFTLLISYFAIALLIGILGGIYIFIKLKLKDKIRKRESSPLLLPDDEDSEWLNLKHSIQNEKDYLKKKESYLQIYWKFHGKFVSRHPWKIIAFSLLGSLILGVGLIRVDTSVDPSELWIPRNSPALEDQKFFQDNFKPSQRIEQLIITPKHSKNSSIIYFSYFSEILDIHDEILKTNVFIKNRKFSWKNFCYRPPSSSGGCIIETPLEIIQSNRTKLENLKDSKNLRIFFEKCLSDPLQKECLSHIGTPILPHKVLGGFDEVKKNYINSTAAIITYILNDNPNQTEAIKAWEQEFLNIAKKERKFVQVEYSAQKSLEDEMILNQKPDTISLIVVYIISLFYLSLITGKFFPLKKYSIIKSKFLLSLFNLFLVVTSTFATLGIVSALGFKINFLISTAVPFILLALILDNSFFILNTWEKIGSSGWQSNENRLGETLFHVGPSILNSSLNQSLILFFGFFTKIPIVESFCLSVGIGVIVGFFLTVTSFISFMILDGDRIKQNKVDCIPCISLDAEDDDVRTWESTHLGLANSQNKPEQGQFIKNIFVEYYTPLLLHPISKIVVLFIFFAGFFFAIYQTSQISLGFDQTILLNDNSYLISYEKAKSEYLTIGPPFYIVIKEDFDYSISKNQNEICSNPGCSFNSLVNRFSSAPFIFSGLHCWLDDYLVWAQSKDCCTQVHGAYCFNATDPGCKPCFQNLPNGRPEPHDFRLYLRYFLMSIPTESCKISGSSFREDVLFSSKEERDGTIAVGTSRIRGYHQKLTDPSDFIKAFIVTHELARYDSQVTFFAYSSFYPYYDQYLHIRTKTAEIIGFALIGVLLFSFLSLSNIWLAFVSLLTTIMITIDLMGVMSISSVSLDCIAIINIILSIGISSQFIAHLLSFFQQRQNSPKTRVNEALNEVGAPTLYGVSMTKLTLIPLGFASCAVFRIYFFRIFVSVVLLSLLHGLIFLPSFLSFFGTLSNPFKSKEKSTTTKF